MSEKPCGAYFFAFFENFFVPILTSGGQSGVPIIGNNVQIGANAVIVGGVEIGDNAIVGAGAVVLKDVPAACVACGVPATVVKKLVEEK